MIAYTSRTVRRSLSTSGRSINAAVARATPTGFTPIGYFLQQAATDFPGKGQRTLVLVSDGEDTCGTPTPSVAARRLDAQGIVVRVDTVGLSLQGNDRARRQLKRVAAATGGRYYPADGTAALTQRLVTASQRAVARFKASGEPIAGGPAATQATEMQAGTDYVDDIRPGEARFYSFPAGTGQVVQSTLTEDGATEFNCCLQLSLLDPDFNDVGSDLDANTTGTAQTLRAESDEPGVEDAGSSVVQVQLDEGSANRRVRYQFEVGVTGAALESPSPSATPSEAASSETPSEAASPTETSPTASPTNQAPATAADSAQGQGPGGLLWAVLEVLLVLVLLAVAAVGVALARLRSP